MGVRSKELAQFCANPDFRVRTTRFELRGAAEFFAGRARLTPGTWVAVRSGTSMKALRNTCPKLHALLGLALLQAGCADTINNHYYVEESAGQGGSGGDGGIPPLETGSPDAPKPDVEASAHQLAPFEKPGTRFWLAVSEAQLSRMNEGGGVVDGPLDGDLYSPEGGGATFVLRLARS